MTTLLILALTLALTFRGRAYRQIAWWALGIPFHWGSRKAAWNARMLEKVGLP